MAARKAGMDVTVVTRRSEASNAIEEAGIEVIPLEMARRGLGPLQLLREVRSVARIYARLQPDIVHHVALRPVVVGGLAARVSGVDSVVSAIAGMGFAFAGSGRKWLATIVRGLLKPALSRGVVIVQNPDDRQAVESLGVDDARVRLIPGAGVDVVRFVPRDEPPEPLVVMLPSRLLWDKGVGEFVAAARTLKGRARFVLAGRPDPGNPASVDETQLASWEEERVIEWWGHRDDMPDTLNQAHVVCLPSYREGLPKVVIEAMACARPVITTDTPGCRDCVRHEDNGLLVPVGDVPALTAAIERLLEDRELRHSLGGRGRERAEKEFSQERVIGETLAIYRELLG